MTEEGTLSIVRREDTYKVRYASNNPHSMDRQPYQCTNAEELGALLHRLAVDAWYIKQAFAELWKRGFAALPTVLAVEQIQAYFLPGAAVATDAMAVLAQSPYVAGAGHRDTRVLV